MFFRTPADGPVLPRNSTRCCTGLLYAAAGLAGQLIIPGVTSCLVSHKGVAPTPPRCPSQRTYSFDKRRVPAVRGFTAEVCADLRRGDDRRAHRVLCCTMGRTISTTCVPPAAWCGTPDGYTNHRCRGERCTAANVARNRAWRERRRTEPTPAHVHGTTNGYRSYGCRCDECREANADDQYRYRQTIKLRKRGLR